MNLIESGILCRALCRSPVENQLVLQAPEFALGFAFSVQWGEQLHYTE